MATFPRRKQKLGRMQPNDTATVMTKNAPYTRQYGTGGGGVAFTCRESNTFNIETFNKLPFVPDSGLLSGRGEGLEGGAS